MDSRATQDRASLRPGGGHLVTFVGVLLSVAPFSSGETLVHRCTHADGSIELSQFPCPYAADSQEIRVEDYQTGWTPSAPQQREKGKAETKPRKRPREASSRPRGVAVRNADRCWKKHRQLEEVNWKLRHGYRPSEGVKLRRRRDTYEGFIDRYCEQP
jgi:hypothetical protein